MTGQLKITSRQLTILTFIRDHCAKFGYPPSIREIGQSVGLASTSSVQHQLRQLEMKGYIRRDPSRARALQVHLPEEAA